MFINANDIKRLMNARQINILKGCISRDSPSCGLKDYFNLPLLRKSVNDIKSVNNKQLKSIDLNKQYTLTKDKNVYCLYAEYTRLSQCLYVITLNDNVIYYVFSSIYAPAIDAWYELTEIKHGYGVNKRTGCWTWASKEDFDCIDHHWDDRQDTMKQDWFLNLESDYQRMMREKTNKHYIDKLIIK